MTQRTEGLVTYWQETTRANVDREDWGTVAEVTQDCGRIRVSTSPGVSLGADEARALRDAITVMLGETVQVLTPASAIQPINPYADVAERIIARLGGDTNYANEDFRRGVEAAYSSARRIVREECGVAE